MSPVRIVESSWKPTAATVPSLRAVTPESWFTTFGLGLRMILQLVPSQCAINGGVASQTWASPPAQLTSAVADPATVTNVSDRSSVVLGNSVDIAGRLVTDQKSP